MQILRVVLLLEGFAGHVKIEVTQFVELFVFDDLLFLVANAL